MRYGIVEEHHARFVYERAEKAIVGFEADGALHAPARVQEQLDVLFEGNGSAPDAVTLIAATDDSGTELYGAVVLDAPYYADLAAKEPATARSFAKLHRIVSGLFVVDEHRGRGLGTHLLRELAAMHALQAGARYLDGFVDNRNGSTDFYRRAGLTVMPHNTGLPARWPTNTTLKHVPQVNGHWFYLDLFAHYADRMYCSVCGGELAVIPGDAAGRLACPNMRVYGKEAVHLPMMAE